MDAHLNAEELALEQGEPPTVHVAVDGEGGRPRKGTCLRLWFWCLPGEWRTMTAHNLGTLPAALHAIDLAQPDAGERLKHALVAHGVTGVAGLIELLARGAQGRAREREAEAEATTPWRESRLNPDDPRPGYWRKIDGVGTISVRQCRPSWGHSTPSWTAALNGSILTGNSLSRPCFYPSCAAAQAAALTAAGEILEQAAV